MYRFISILAIALLFVGCAKQNPVTPPAPTPDAQQPSWVRLNGVGPVTVNTTTNTASFTVLYDYTGPVPPVVKADLEITDYSSLLWLYPAAPQVAPDYSIPIAGSLVADLEVKVVVKCGNLEYANTYKPEWVYVK